MIGMAISVGLDQWREMELAYGDSPLHQHLGLTLSGNL